MLEFLSDNWVYIVIASMIAIKVLNKITDHFSEYKGLVKVCLFIIDLLDIIKITPAPKYVKDKATGRTIVNTILILSIILLSSGCANFMSRCKASLDTLNTCMQGCALQCSIEAGKKAICPIDPQNP